MKVDSRTDRPSRTTAEMVREIVADILQMSPNPNDLADDADLFALGLDSINTVQLIVSLEEAFEIEFGLEEISYENARSICCLTAMLEAKKAG